MSKVLKKLFKDEDVKSNLEENFRLDKVPKLELVPNEVSEPSIEPAPAKPDAKAPAAGPAQMPPPPVIAPPAQKSKRGQFIVLGVLLVILEIVVMDAWLPKKNPFPKVTDAKAPETKPEVKPEIKPEVKAPETKVVTAEVKAPETKPVAAAQPLPPGAQLNHLGIQLYQNHDYKEALARFERLSQDYPTSSGVLNNIGMTHLRLKDYKKAKEYLNESLKSNASNATAYNNLGALDLANKDNERALENFKKALVINPNLNESRLNMGRAYEQLNKPSEAVAEYETYIKDPSGDPVLKEMLKKRIPKLNLLLRYIKDGKKNKAE